MVEVKAYNPTPVAHPNKASTKGKLGRTKHRGNSLKNNTFLYYVSSVPPMVISYGLT